MIVGFDHAVILVEDLETTVERAKASGFTVSPGGQHSDQATRNAIIAFADGTYLELLAFTSTPPPEGHYFAERHSRGHGLAEYALLSDNLSDDLATLEERGLAFPSPVHLERERPDGARVSWNMSLPRDMHPNSGIPFLIQDITQRQQRVPGDVEATSHQNGALGIGGVTVLVSAMSQAVGTFARLVHSDDLPQQGHFGSGRGLTLLPIPGQREQWIALMQPVADSAPQRHFDQFGVGPYALTLRTEAQGPLFPGVGTALPPEAFDGARIYLQGD